MCVANREGQKIDCMKAGIERPLYANRDETGQKVTTYKGVGRPYAIDGKGINFFAYYGKFFWGGNSLLKYWIYIMTFLLYCIGTALLTMSGSPNIRGLTIDTASDSLPIIDEWGKNDVI